MDPHGEPKVDKTTILADAIRFVQQVTVEINQLKQLNKFLEVGSARERSRGRARASQCTPSLRMSTHPTATLDPTKQCMHMHYHEMGVSACLDTFAATGPDPH